MTLGWMIFFAGLGTFLLRTAGVWVNPSWLKAKWLDHLPFAVILVMVIASLIGFMPPTAETMQGVGAIASTVAVIVASIKRVPLFACVVLGCAIYGAFVSSSI